MARYPVLQDEIQTRIRNSRHIALVVIVLFVVLAARLAKLQIIDAEKNIALSKENRMQLKPVKPPRGRIYDRHATPLARNRPSYAIAVLPYKIEDKRQLVHNLCRIRTSSGDTVFDSAACMQRIEKAYWRRFDVTPIKEDVSVEVVSIVAAHSNDLQGVVIQTEARREYPFDKKLFHVCGYMGEIPREIFDSLRQKGYRYGDKIGKTGVERTYESVLRGRYGYDYVEVNAYGKNLGKIEGMPHKAPEPGHDILLTIDARIQQKAYEAFPDSIKGAVVVLNPQNGEVLAMISKPSLDPNIFSLAARLRNKYWQQAAFDSTHPLNNRAVWGLYPPASTFKIVSSMAGLETGEVGAEEIMPQPCTGAFRIGTRVAKCWKLSGHGYLDLTGAMTHSCDVYYYQLGLRVGYEPMNRYARMCGLGVETGIDLPKERKGWLSGKEAYNERFASRGWTWTRGLLLDMAIGQQQVVTPLQLAIMVGAVGNGDVWYRPHLLKSVRTRDGTIVRSNEPTVAGSLEVDSSTIAALHEAIRSVVAPGGTGWRAMVEGVDVGGKTGSAENPHSEKTHALFVACAPLDDPCIAVSVVAENAGHGGSICAPVAGDILTHFFTETQKGRRIAQAQDSARTRR
jgi:penicillin-binding protein 2